MVCFALDAAFSIRSVTEVFSCWSAVWKPVLPFCTSPASSFTVAWAFGAACPAA